MNDIQNRVLSFMKQYNISNNLNIRMIDLSSEVGELSKEVLKSTNYGEETFKKSANFDTEIGDVLFSLIWIANICGIDIEECLNKVIIKYKNRLNMLGNIASIE